MFAHTYSRALSLTFVLVSPVLLAHCYSAVDPAEGTAVAGTESDIIGGTLAGGVVPWEVQISAPNLGYAHLCSGTILPSSESGRSSYILTAAQCAEPTVPGAFVVKAGKYHLNQTDSTEQSSTGAAWVVHPGWDSKQLRNDVAILKLSTPLVFNSSVQPINLPDGRYDSAFTGTETGWGTTVATSTTYSEQLMTADVPIVDGDVCAAVMDPWRKVLPTMLCGGYADGQQSACYGDLGGPLTAKNGAGTVQQIGLASWVHGACDAYTVFTQIVDYVSWIRSVTTPQVSPCQGRTIPGDTAWQVQDADDIFLDIDTSQCAFSQTPEYFTSIGGNSNHYTVQGITSIYLPTPTGFRIYLYKPSITPALANQYKWHVNWQALAVNQNSPQLCTGRSPTTATKWIEYSANTIYTDVDTSACGNTATPRYFTSLGGEGSHWATTGVSSIYLPTAKGFRVYVAGSNANTQAAALNHWYVSWAATPAAAQTSLDECTGTTTAGAGWVQYGSNGIYLDVNTSACGRSVKPVYLTSLAGTSSHYTALGSTSIYLPTALGFRVYLNQPGITVAAASSRQYAINWAAYR